MEMKKCIYIADDDVDIREAIQVFLENEGYLVTAFETGEALLASFQKEPCDLVILDVMMPGDNGFTICTKIRKISTVPIIMLTARDSDLDYATGMSLGSDDYFTKPFSAISLVMRVKAIFRRIAYDQQTQSTVNSQAICTCGDVSMYLQNKIVTIQNEKVNLTPNEYDLLQYLMQRQAQAVSREELLEHVWGYQMQIESRATDDTVRRLRKKLEHSKVSIEAVWGFGFRLKVCEEHA